MIPKTKKDDWRKWRNKLDLVFSKFIRLRDAGKPCIACAGLKPLQCGHFIKRQYLGTRWNEENCQGECIHCNHYLQGNDVKFAEGLVSRYGISVLDRLLFIKQTQSQRPSIEWLKMQIDHYRVECEKMENRPSGFLE